jgi:hypothetical protein
LFSLFFYGVIKDSADVMLTAALAILHLAVAVDLILYVLMEPQLWIQTVGMLLLGAQAVLSVFFNPFWATLLALFAASMAPIKWSHSWLFKPLHYVTAPSKTEPATSSPEPQKGRKSNKQQ